MQFMMVKSTLIMLVMEMIELLSIINLIVDVLLEVGSIVLMGCICFIVYVYGKIFLIRIGLINPEQEDGKDS